MNPTLDFVLPTVCFVCGRPPGPLLRMGACAGCWAELRPLRKPLCATCSLPLPAGTDLLGPAAGRCAECTLRRAPRRAVRAAVLYDPLARRFLLRAKYGRRRELLAAIGLQLGRTLHHTSFASACDCVVAVPSHPLSLLRRGFNPAHEIARAVASQTHLPLVRGVLRRRLVGRVSIKRMSAAQRRSESVSAIEPRRFLRRSAVLLVDDVLTTGATAASCADALEAAGVRDVRVAVWARTPPGVRV